MNSELNSFLSRLNLTMKAIVTFLWRPCIRAPCTYQFSEIIHPLQRCYLKSRSCFQVKTRKQNCVCVWIVVGFIHCKTILK